jgi:anti-anti-sigma factor
MIKMRPPSLIVDPSGVHFIDSSGIAVLIHAMQDVENYGGRLTLSGLNDNVRPILEMAQLDHFFVIDQRDGELMAD